MKNNSKDVSTQTALRQKWSRDESGEAGSFEEDRSHEGGSTIDCCFLDKTSVERSSWAL